MNYLKSRSDASEGLPRSSFVNLKPRIFIEALPSSNPSEINLCCEVLGPSGSSERESQLIEELRQILHDPLSLEEMSNML